MIRPVMSTVDRSEHGPARAVSERLTCCEDVRRQRQGEGRDPWCEVSFKDSAGTLGLRQLVSDAISSDWR